MKNMRSARGRDWGRRGTRTRYPRWTRGDRSGPPPRHDERRGRGARAWLELPREGTLLLADCRITAVPVAGGDPFYVITSEV